MGCRYSQVIVMERQCKNECIGAADEAISARYGGISYAMCEQYFSWLKEHDMQWTEELCFL